MCDFTYGSIDGAHANEFVITIYVCDCKRAVHSVDLENFNSRLSQIFLNFLRDGIMSRKILFGLRDMKKKLFSNKHNVTKPKQKVQIIKIYIRTSVKSPIRYTVHLWK